MSESLIKFPCEFPIKITGKNIPEFRAAVEAVVKENIADKDFISLNEQLSAKANYSALTLTAKFYDQQSLDELYIKLGKLNEVLMVL